LGEREIVPDVLRGFAIMAMLIAHAAPLLPDRPAVVSFVIASLNSVASPLFAMVMGMSAALVIARAGRSTSATWVLVAQNTARGVLLVVLGIWLSTWGSWIAIVLAPLGFTLIVGMPIALLRSRWVAVALAVVLVAGAPVVAAVTSATMQIAPTMDPLGRLLLESFFTNTSYRVLSLLPFFFAGVLLLRHGFRRDRTVWILLAVALVSYSVQPILRRVTGQPEEPSGGYTDTLHDVGLVFVVYVAVVLLASTRSGAARRAAGALFVPLRIVGTLALSIYVLQVAVVAWIAHPYPADMGETNYYLLSALIVVVVPAVGVVWWYFLGLGPIERVMGLVTGRRTVTGRRREPVAADGR
jgi:hypothetical protein